MADLAQQLPTESEMDSEFKIAADLARERAGDRLVSITERRRDTIMTPGGSPDRGVAEHTRPAFGTPSNSLYEDDAPSGRAGGNASRQGALDEPSPAFVQSPDADNKGRAERPAPPEADDTVLPEQEGGMPEQQSSESTQPAPDYSDQFNKSPETTSASLVDDDGSSLGIQPAAAGITGGRPSSGQQSISEEDQTGEGPNAQQPGMIDQAKNNSSGRTKRGESANQEQLRRQIAQIEKEIFNKQKEIKRLKNDIKSYKNTHILPLQIKKIFVVGTDIIWAIVKYEIWILTLTCWVWWILVIGVIIDVSLVWTSIVIYYGIGLIKGPLVRLIDEQLEQHKNVVKEKEKKKKPLEEEIKQLNQQQFQLTQVFQNQAVEEGQAPQKGPPTVGGISLAS